MLGGGGAERGAGHFQPPSSVHLCVLMRPIGSGEMSRGHSRRDKWDQSGAVEELFSPLAIIEPDIPIGSSPRSLAIHIFFYTLVILAS